MGRGGDLQDGPSPAVPQRLLVGGGKLEGDGRGGGVGGHRAGGRFGRLPGGHHRVYPVSGEVVAALFVREGEGVHARRQSFYALRGSAIAPVEGVGAVVAGGLHGDDAVVSVGQDGVEDDGVELGSGDGSDGDGGGVAAP